MNWATSSNECFPLREVGGGAVSACLGIGVPLRV